jgi:hypothetical protein
MASKRNFARQNNTAFGPEDRLKLLSKLWISVENTRSITYMTAHFPDLVQVLQ